MLDQVHCGTPGWNGIPLPTFCEEQPEPFMKPKAFWTGTVAEDGYTDWMRFIEADPDPLADHRYQVVGDPRLLVLRSDMDFWAALHESGLSCESLEDSRDNMSMSAHLVMSVFWNDDTACRLWAHVRDCYDGVHVPAKFSGFALRMWDVESTAWFRPWDHLVLLPSLVSLPATGMSRP